MFLHQYQKNLVAMDDREALRVFHKAVMGEGQKVRKGEKVHCPQEQSSLYIPCDDGIVILRCSITEPEILKTIFSVLQLHLYHLLCQNSLKK